MIVIVVKSFTIPVSHSLPSEKVAYLLDGEKLGNQRKPSNIHVLKNVVPKMSPHHQIGVFAETKFNFFFAKLRLNVSSYPIKTQLNKNKT
jgi:hypothetical protein